MDGWIYGCMDYGWIRCMDGMSYGCMDLEMAVTIWLVFKIG